MKFMLIVFLCFFSAFSYAKVNPQQKRFLKLMNVLSESFVSTDATAIALDLAAKDARYHVYMLQSLSKIYSKTSSDGKTRKYFKEMYRRYKEIENALGKYSKWKGVKEKAEAEKALLSLVKLIEEQWLPRDEGESLIHRHMREVKELETWNGFKQDRKNIVEYILSRIKKVSETDFDLTRLEKDRPTEDGNGLHELRRDLKWIVMHQRSMNGLFQFLPEDRDFCSIDSYAYLERGGKYGSLPADPTEKINACHIPSCLFLGLVSVVNRLGDIKDSIEEIPAARISDKVPSEFVGPATEIYNEINDFQLHRRYSEALRSCI